MTTPNDATLLAIMKHAKPSFGCVLLSRVYDYRMYPTVNAAAKPAIPACPMSLLTNRPKTRCELRCSNWLTGASV